VRISAAILRCNFESIKGALSSKVLITLKFVYSLSFTKSFPFLLFYGHHLQRFYLLFVSFYDKLFTQLSHFPSPFTRGGNRGNA